MTISLSDRETGVRTPLLSVALRHEQDVVAARQRARAVAALLGFDRQDQTRFTTAVSEIARNAYEYAGGGRVEFALIGSPAQALQVRVTDEGKGIAELNDILNGRYISHTGMGLGILGARRLSDRFRIESRIDAGTIVEIEKDLPRRYSGQSPPNVANIVRDLAALSPRSPFDEVRDQNQELLHALDELQSRQTALDQLNSELLDTNRGVIALHSQLEQTAEELRRSSEMKTRFLSNMSHEFRTPLNSIIGLARLLLERSDGPLSEEQEKQVNFIRLSAQQLTEIVNDLLDTAKIESGKATVQAQEFHIEDLFSSLRGVFKPLVDGGPRGVALVFEDSLDLPPLINDEAKITQILRNFISNALKFTEIGSVTLSATLLPPKSPAHQVEIAFTVADTGIGIAPEDQLRIFEEFEQVDGEVQRQVKGTGLGLPLCRKLAGLLNGRIEIQSRVGEGSKFILIIPSQYETPDTAAESVNKLYA